MHISILHVDTNFRFIQNIETLFYLVSFMLIWNLSHDFYFKSVLYCFDQTGEPIESVHEHTKLINDIQKSKDEMMFVTASKDHTAKVESNFYKYIMLS